MPLLNSLRGPYRSLISVRVNSARKQKSFSATLFAYRMKRPPRHPSLGWSFFETEWLSTPIRGRRRRRMDACYCHTKTAGRLHAPRTHTQLNGANAMFDTAFSVCQPANSGCAAAGPINSTPIRRALRPCGVTAYEAGDLDLTALSAHGFGIVGIVRRTGEQYECVIEYEDDVDAAEPMYDVLPEPLYSDEAFVTVLLAYARGGCAMSGKGKGGDYHRLAGSSHEALLMAQMLQYYALAHYERNRMRMSAPWAPGQKKPV